MGIAVLEAISGIAGARQPSTGRACTSGGATSAGCRTVTPTATTSRRDALLDAPGRARGERAPVPGLGRPASTWMRRPTPMRRSSRAARLDGPAVPAVRHHLPRRGPGRARRVAVPGLPGHPVDRADGRRRAQLAQAAAGAAQPDPAGDQRLGADLARARRCRQGLGASGSRWRARAATMFRRLGCRGASAPSSSSTRRPRPRCLRPDRPHTGPSRDDVDRRRREGLASAALLLTTVRLRSTAATRRSCCSASSRSARPLPRCGAPSRRRGASCTARAWRARRVVLVATGGQPALRAVDHSGISSAGRFAAK